MSDRKYIYILGRGHNGSTVVDALLGNSHKVFGCGELVSGLSRYPEGLVSTGKRMFECEVWSRVFENWKARCDGDIAGGVDVITGQAHVRNFWKVLVAQRGNKWVDKVRRANETLVESIYWTTGKQVIVDSSKEYTRGLFIARFCPGYCIVHLVRDPEDTIYSYYTRLKSGEPVTFLRRRVSSKRFLVFSLAVVAASWNMGQILGGVIRLISRRRFLLLNYDRLCRNPEDELRRLGEFCQFDVNDIIQRIKKGEEFQNGFQIGGNRMRFRKSFTFKPDIESRRMLPIRYRVLTWIVCFPFLLWHRCVR